MAIDRVHELDGLKAEFTSSASRKKLRLLTSLSRRAILDPEPLIAYHETLCFLRAFPDQPALLRLAENELQRFADRVTACREESGGELPGQLWDTGIAGTPFHYPYGLAMVAWLVDRFGDAVDLDWDAYEDREDDSLATVIFPLANWVETAALDDELLSVRDWFEQAKGKRNVGFLRWLVERFRESGISSTLQQTLFDDLELSIRWDLGTGPGSRSLARMPVDRIFYHRGNLRGRTRDLRREINRPLKRHRPVGKRRARAWVDLVRCALSVRSRELYPIALASEEEVYEADVGRGVKIILYGMLPDRRLPLESDYGAFIVKNGLPIGYGVGALLCDRMEIAVNVYPTFRQGESSFVFEQFNRFFRHQFDCRVFLVERYQLGHENDEGLDAGSFWFYYKLGFRSVDPKIAALADQEAARLKKTRGARSDRRMLRRLARRDVILRLDRAEGTGSEQISLTRIGLRVSRFIEEEFGGERRKAEQHCSRRVARSLGLTGWRAWPLAEREAFENLSPLFALLPGLGRMSVREKKLLGQALRAKGSKQEAPFARASASLTPIHRGLVELSR